MKTLALFILLTVGLVALDGCHWQHRRHRYGYTGGYYPMNIPSHTRIIPGQIVREGAHVARVTPAVNV